jgi:Ca2+-binding RTX toxin-like protein
MKSSRRAHTGLLGFEGLENKTLMAVDVAYRADIGTLFITGSESADVIQVQEGAYGPRIADGSALNAFVVITSNAQGQEVQRRVIPTMGVPSRITIETRGGNDVVWCSTRTEVYAFLGDGDDTMQCGNGNDYVNGDRGNDTIHGGDGDDAIRGSEGGDRLHGGRGNDQIYAHEGLTAGTKPTLGSNLPGPW